MKTLIVYCSKYKNNTKEIAQVFKEEIETDLLNINEHTDVNINNYDLIGFGSGVYRESMSQKLFKFVDKLDLNNKNVFVFSTSGIGVNFYNKKLIKLLESKGAVVKDDFACKGSFNAKEITGSSIINIVFSFIGKLSKGHPDDNDFKNAKIFIKNIIESV